MSEKTRILFLAANPIDSTLLRIDTEVREIQDKMRAAEFRNNFELITRWAVRPNDLIQAFNETQPHIVHFSGHGTTNSQIVLESEIGNAIVIGQDIINQLFRTMLGNIRLVVLNACYSEDQAKTIADVVGCAIGMEIGIDDTAATVFASYLYAALAFGASVVQSVDQARLALMINCPSSATIPRLVQREGVDANSIRFSPFSGLRQSISPMAIQFLSEAVTKNTPIIVARSDGEYCVIIGDLQHSVRSDFRRIAEYSNAIENLICAGLIQCINDGLYHVTHHGYLFCE